MNNTKFVTKIWNFAKQYPFTFIVSIVFLFMTISTFIMFIDINAPITKCLLIPVLFCTYLIIIYFWQKFNKDKNRFFQGIVLFFINFIFYFMFCGYTCNYSDSLYKRVENPDIYVKQVFYGNYSQSWKQFGDGLYLNINKICYYKDKQGNSHALITEKHIKDKTINSMDKVCAQYYKEYKDYNSSFQSFYVVYDYNLSRKNHTLLYMCFFSNNDLNLVGRIKLDKNDPENTTPISTNTNSHTGHIYKYLINNQKGK